jgi:hypothetical protein
MFKVAAVSVTKVADGDGAASPAPTVGAPAPLARSIPPTAGGTSAEAESETADSGIGASRLGVEG